MIDRKRRRSHRLVCVCHTMSLLRCLCCVRLHKWRGDENSIAKRYRHNTFWDKTTNVLDSPRAIIQTCQRCGKKRIWSFNRGTWKPYCPIEGQRRDTSVAWQVVGAEPTEPVADNTK